MANGYVGYYSEPTFYEQNDVAERLEKLGVEKGSIHKVTVEEEESGFLGIAALRKITLLDANDNFLENLFAKIYPAEESKGIVLMHHPIRGVREGVMYRFDNLKLQSDELGLLTTPRVIHHGTYTGTIMDIGKTKGTTKIKKEELVHVLLMEYLAGPTSDMDVIALRDAIDIREKELDNKLITEEDKDKLREDQKELRSILKNDIVLNILNTMKDFSRKAKDYVDGTKQTGIKIDVRDDSYKRSYMDKRESLFTVLTYWNLINSGEYGSIDDVKKDKTLELPHRWNELKKLMKPLESYMFVEGGNVYSQGDQHLRNFKRIKRRGSNEQTMGIYDMESAKIEDPIFGAARLLSSYLLEFNREEIREIYRDGFSDLVAEFKPNVSQKKTELAFELWDLMHTLWSGCKRAHDELYNKKKYDLGMSGGRHRMYDSTTLPLTRSIELPRAIDYRLYDPQIAIDTTKKHVQIIIDGLIEDCNSTGSYEEPNLVKPLTELRDFFERNIYETKIKNS